jgi:SSS family solute:Na+ symporter
MNYLDWTIIILYLTGMISLSVYLGRSQSSQEDYFVGGRKLSWWSVGISTMATQTSAISFISIPAFVALKTGGGLTWLQYELGVPLAMIIVMAFLIPFFRRLKLVSVYEYLEYRYGPPVRYLVSLVFLISRGLATGVGVYASGIVLSVCLGVPLWATILIIGIVTVIYDTIGGITAVVYSDVIQMGILLGGIVFCIAYAAYFLGGMDDIWSTFPVSRRIAIDPASGLSGGSAVPFWAFLCGRIFLYTAYYGTDQSQVQRELSAATTADTKKSLMWISLPGLHWMWWNVFGFMIVALVSTAVSAVKPDGQTKNIDQYVLRGTTFFKDERHWLPAYTTLIAFFALMLAVLILLSWR